MAMTRAPMPGAGASRSAEAHRLGKPAGLQELLGIGSARGGAPVPRRIAAIGPVPALAHLDVGEHPVKGARHLVADLAVRSSSCSAVAMPSSCATAKLVPGRRRDGVRLRVVPVLQGVLEAAQEAVILDQPQASGRFQQVELRQDYASVATVPRARRRWSRPPRMMQ
jgi:hypothetical protein